MTRATDASPEIRRAGLEELCGRYWKPVYGYLRRSWPRSVEDAKDLTQAFFLWLTEEDLLDRYSKEKASFRTYLKVLLKHFAEHRDRALGRLKRGGGAKILDLDRAALPAPRTTDPVEEFERAWRNEVVARAMERVRERLKAEGRETQFQVFEAYDLAAPPDLPSYEEIAARFGRTPSDVRNYLHAVRQLLRLEIRAELARTTSGPGELEDEWNALFGS